MRRFRIPSFLLFVLSIPVLSFAQVNPPPEKKVEVAGVVKSRVLEPGSNLVIQNLPSIPLELVESVKKYTESKPVFASNWHPTKREILVGKRAGNVNQVHLLSAPLGELKQLTDFPDPVGGGNWDPKTGDYFLFFKATGGTRSANSTGTTWRPVRSPV